jgi:hypothetical protein
MFGDLGCKLKVTRDFLYERRIYFSKLYSILNVLFTTWSYALCVVATGCSSPHCKECRTQHFIHCKLSHILDFRETNVLFKSSSNLSDTNLELLQSRSL